MIRWDSFGRSAAFAAVAALAWIPWLVVIGPVAGPSSARTLYLIAVTALYVAGLGGPAARPLGVAVVTGIAGCTVAVVGRDPTVLCLGLAVALAVARSAVLYPAAPARAILTEAALAGGGLAFARLLGGRSPLALALPIWGFLLVQSCFFLIAGARERRTGGGHPDPFEAAYARAMEIIERPLTS